METSRIWFTAAQKAELWERWKNGQSAAAISRALERKNKTGVERIVVLHGGIVPAPRRRALAALRLVAPRNAKRVSRGIAVGRSIRQIAQGLGRAPSTVRPEEIGGATAAVRPIEQTGLIGVPGSGRCAPSHFVVVALHKGATMARGAEARTAMVAAA